MTTAVPTDFHTDDPQQLKADLEKLARAVKAATQSAADRAPVWPPTPLRFGTADVQLGQGARFGATATANLPIATTADRGRSLAVRVTAAVTVTLTARGGQQVDGAATASLVGPGFWIVWWDGEGWTVAP